MTFEDWMQYKGLSPSSIKKYEGAIRGIISEWSMENGLTAGPLTSLVSRSSFEIVALKIRNLSVYKERNERGHNMYNSALSKFSEYLAEGFENDIEEDIEKIFAMPGISATEKNNLVKSRIGQGTFRQKLVAYWNSCAVTGFKDTSLLIASHIKPWRASNNTERLDLFNGLLLAPNLDKAFDFGYISFDSTGLIKISPLLTEAEKLGISADMRISHTPKHEVFMAFHRTSVFRAK